MTRALFCPSIKCKLYTKCKDLEFEFKKLKKLDVLKISVNFLAIF